MYRYQNNTGIKLFSNECTNVFVLLTDLTSDWFPDSSPAVRPGSSASLSRYNILPAIGTPVPSALPDLPTPQKQMPPSPDAKPTRSILKGKSGQPEAETNVKPIVESIDDTRSDTKIINDSTGNNLLIESIDDVRSGKTVDDSQPSGSELEVTFKPLIRDVSVPPEPGDGDPKLLLAVKLPNGTRIQRNFSTLDHLDCVLHFAEVSAQMDFSGCCLVCDVPRAVFKDLSKTIGNSGLASRTVLHIQTPDVE